ncbi:MAG: two pore domain potassium channel family protein [Acidobacteria bacterium]|nr:MAG: two pore domain potassium channel family protein [Acidobacteriota bacterium]
MHVLATIAGVIIILAVLLDAFETVVLPRRVQRTFRLTSWFYRNTWRPWTSISGLIKSPNRREAFLSYFGPLSLLTLLVFWAVGLILSFAFLQFGLGEHVQLGNEPITFGKLLYLSGETFFTLGLGDIAPVSTAARLLTVLEGGMGFAFLGVVIGYLPVVYTAFSDRELEISMLDSRAGSPPTAAELLNRLGCCPDPIVLDEIFRDWERWSADLLASHLSYPVLSFFRSQHSNQSWLGALTVMLDVTSLVLAGIDGIHPEQARLTFAMARHAAVDLAQVVRARYNPHAPDRLPKEVLGTLRKMLAANGLRVRSDEEADLKLAKLRSLYESYVEATARNLVITLPPWMHPEKKRDNWQGGPWDRMIQAKGLGEHAKPADEHF